MDNGHFAKWQAANQMVMSLTRQLALMTVRGQRPDPVLQDELRLAHREAQVALRAFLYAQGVQVKHINERLNSCARLSDRARWPSAKPMSRTHD